MKSIDFVTNIAPHYRKSLWLELLRLESYRIRFFFGVEEGSSIRQIDFQDASWLCHAESLNELTNIRLRKVLIWQRGVISNALRTSSDVSIFLGDMHVLSTWIAVLVLQLRRRKVVFWGHGLYGNERWLKRSVRLAFLRLGNMNLVYGERAKKLLIGHGFSQERVRVIYNSLDYATQKCLRESAIEKEFYENAEWFRRGNLPVLIFVGRLTKQKELAQLISVVKTLNTHGPRFNLLLVGDGPEGQYLKSIASEDTGTIRFYGACYQEDQLAKLISNADLCVSPGEIGLTTMHSLSYGTPACTHGDMSRQMPEAEAIVEGVTGTFFDGCTGNLQETIESWFRKRCDRGEVRAACYRIIDESYNPEAQCRILVEALDCL